MPVHTTLYTQHSTQYPLHCYHEFRLLAQHEEVCHSRCACENWKGYVVKHNYVNWDVLKTILHVSAFTGRLQVVFKRT